MSLSNLEKLNLVPFDLERPNLAWKHMWVRGVCPQPQGRGSSVVEFWGTSYMRADGTRKATKFWVLIKVAEGKIVQGRPRLCPDQMTRMLFAV